VSELLIFGLGYSGTATARYAREVGFSISATSRSGSPGCIPFDAAGPALLRATHVLSTAPPGPDGDPVLARYAAAIAAAPHLRWIGYLSSTVVYGNRDGAWVDEDTPPAPSQDRGRRRLGAERAWARFAATRTVDIFRAGGIYGPGRSPFDDLRAELARRIVKPNHCFGRIHRDDLARAVAAAMQQTHAPGVRTFNLADDEPAESATVVTEAASLLGVAPPAPIAFADAEPTMSTMARSFWAENRKVASSKTKAALGIDWLWPTYREGLRAILAEERSQGSA